MKNRQTYSRFIQNVLPWGDLNKGRIIQLLHHCIEHDITSFDSSDFRGRDHVGKRFGIALSESGLSRDEIQLIAKHGIPQPEGEKLIETIDQILLDLETDYLDLLLLDLPHLTPEIRNAAEQLFAQGKIMELGGLNLEAAQMKEFGIPMGANQVSSPFTTHDSLEYIPQVMDASEEIIHFVWCAQRKAQGELKFIPELSQQYNMTPTQIILTWILQHPAHLHPVICSLEKEEITEAVMTKTKKLDPVDWQKIKLIIS